MRRAPQDMPGYRRYCVTDFEVTAGSVAAGADAACDTFGCDEVGACGVAWRVGC